MLYRESQIQRGIIKAIRAYYPQAVVFSVPNEGKRSATMAAVMKANGMMHGVSDIILLHQGKVIFIEVKSEKGRQTEHQKAFQEKVEAEGHRYWLVRSTEEVITSIENINLLTQSNSNGKEKTTINQHAGGA